MPVKSNQTEPFIININKPADISSYDVIRRWKPRLKKFGKVGHFGTLDPFADGVLMLGVAGAQRLNDYIHRYLPKTYLAKGVLGLETDTGDPTGKVLQRDQGQYLEEVIGKFSAAFIQEKLQSEFLGEYFQSPHPFSAAKFKGKPLHQWAREGVVIKKEKVARQVYLLEVVKYEFPYLWIRFTVSSGTYIRTLFSDCAQSLGTIGSLKSLTRESVGGCSLGSSISYDSEDIKPLSVEEVLPFGRLELDKERGKLFSNGVRLRLEQTLSRMEGELRGLYWVYENNRLLGLTEIVDQNLVSKINYHI